MSEYLPPTVEEVRTAIRRIVTPQLRRAFFEGLENPLWLEPLAREGMFRNPPEPITKDDGLTYDVYWPEIAYLERVGPDQPKIVTDILVKIGASNNSWVRRAVFAIGSRLPAEQAAQLRSVLKTIVAGGIQGRVDPRDVNALVISLLGGGEHRLGARLADAIYRPRPTKKDPAKYFAKPALALDEYWYASAMPGLIAALEVDDLKMVVGWLVAWERYSGHLSPEVDTTALTRESIRSRGGLEAYDDAQQVLVEGVRDLAIRAILSDPAKAIATLLEVRMDLAQKLALHGAAEALNRDDLATPQVAGLLDAAVDLLMDPTSQNDHCRIEYGELARAVAAHREINAPGIFAFIAKGPFTDGRDDLRQQFRAGEDDTDDEIDERITAYGDRWRHRWLAAIGVEALPTQLQTTLKELDNRLGAIEHPLDPGDRVISWTGPNSPIPADEMSILTATELVAHLESWHASGDKWGPEPSHEGQGRNLSTVIAGNPEAVDGVARIYDRLRATYLRAILQGWAQALRAGLALPWHQVEETVRGVLEHPDALTFPQEGDNFDDDESFRLAKRAAVDLLEELAAPRPSSRIPGDSMRAFAALLINSANDEIAWREYDQFSGESGMDAMTIALNWEWPRRLRGLVNLISHGRNVSWFAEAKTALQVELARQDKREASSAVIGESIGLLLNVDEDWAIGMIPEWFGGRDDMTGEQQVALSTSLAVYRYHPRLFAALSPSMQCAIHLNGSIAAGWRGRFEPLELIGQWILNGIILGDVSTSDSIAQEYFQFAPPATRGRSLGHIPWSMSHWDEVDPLIRERLERLWDERFDYVRVHPEDREELSEFFWFVKSGKFDASWWLPRLEEVLDFDAEFTSTQHTIGKEIALAASEDPRGAVNVAKLLLKGDSTGSGSSWELREYAIPFIIAEAMMSGDFELANEATALMNELGSQGDLKLSDKVEQAISGASKAEDIPF